MIQIRKMTENDLDQIADIAAEVFPAPWSREAFAEALPMKNALFLLAVEGETVLGYCGMYTALDEGEIINVAVKPEFQKNGIADKLMHALILEGSKCGVHRYFLEVRVSNAAAIQLYEKHGFTRQGIRKNFYKEEHEDAYVMNRIEDIEDIVG